VRAELASRDAANKPWVDKAARIGLAVRGIVFLVLAYLVGKIASGALGSGSSTNKAVSGSGVAQTVADQSGGQVLVFLLGVGLAFYAMFSLLDTVLHKNNDDSDAKRWASLAHGLFRTAVYAAFSVYAFYTAFHPATKTGSSQHVDEKQSEWSARVLNWPAGWFWLGALGVGLLVGAGYLAVTAVRRKFLEPLRRGQMSQRAWQVATVSGVLGHLGRAAVYGIAGWFVLHAAIENDASKSQGVDGSIRKFADDPLGATALYAVAVGLVAFAVWMFCEARYRRV
jgi:Domain of Unknown Function (DUF1206)